MTTLLTLAVLAVLIVFIRNFIHMRPSDFSDAEPVLSLEQYFSGRSRAWGLFEDRFGRVRRQFSIDIAGTWDGRVLTLEQDFVYDDGETSHRIWTITRQEDGHYHGTADDMIGTASGEASGNAFNWSYAIRLRVLGIPLRVDVDDWMFLQSGGVLINHARVSKWGVTLGRVSLFYTSEY